MHQSTSTIDTHCRNAIHQGGYAYTCDPPCQACSGAPVAILTRIPIQRDPVVAAQSHIRQAIRHMAALNVTINAYACEDAFNQPNRATAAMDELDEALSLLAVAR